MHISRHTDRLNFLMNQVEHHPFKGMLCARPFSVSRRTLYRQSALSIVGVIKSTPGFVLP